MRAAVRVCGLTPRELFAAECGSGRRRKGLMRAAVRVCGLTPRELFAAECGSGRKRAPSPRAVCARGGEGGGRGEVTNGDDQNKYRRQLELLGFGELLLEFEEHASHHCWQREQCTEEIEARLAGLYLRNGG